MSKMHRVQIFLDNELLRKLAKIARKKGTSISEIIRAAVKEWLTGCQERDMMNQRLEDLQVIENHRQEILARRGGEPLDIDVAEMIERMRTERINEITSSVFPKVKESSRREDSDGVLPSSL
jgi:Arc/MetJ-type ribon-helix-helix transcriptional regulator